MDFQDGLNALAADTGGRFLHNTNALDTTISVAMAEASRYYLLGWYADADSLKPGKYWSLRVSVKDRPDLKVRLRAGLVDLSQSVPMLQGKRYRPVVNAKDAPTQVPAKVAGKMWLSSIFLREQSPGSVPADVRLNLDAVSNARFSIQRRFTPNSAIQFFVNVHDAAGPDLLIRTTIFQGNQPMIQSPAQSVAASPGNVEQLLIPVAGMLTFRDLAPGSYTLEIEIADPASKTKVSERIPFEVVRKDGSGSIFDSHSE